ncbi:MAG: cupin domain-containing protein [Chelatococcus sp.]|jgi:transcriptional regulator with XRE-family HTH domain|uniref:cupin domain-containing protein n=1 Tax=unclassified Chelatococcus TaxID=2638111 RepID=UPI001BCF4264|nr:MULTISPECIES: cupin domain-containing protein [unclassified Chelatococcus]CAH1671469.1 Transcriptional regulator, MerR family [Hyphomicrobiales bacterium]MBS7739074.1 cupin domain-containing protein [Chelatococcus sp. HY11]MBX3540029.1 cupin domain-containing protein [Chelatococcus sp.]MBX3543509.1 cupin domain-containing protein [Chelatococcus sp.]MCO5076396.1 cupin domain-containing protein [Chelatococcus sp.]
MKNRSKATAKVPQPLTGRGTVETTSRSGVKRSQPVVVEPISPVGLESPTPTEPTLEAARLGRRLQTMRRAQGFTLVDLAAKAGCSASLVSRIENGRLLPSLSVLHKLVAGLGTSMASFLSGSETESCMVVRASDRKEVTLDYLGASQQGLRIEQIIPHSPDRMLQGNLISIAAGHGSAGDYSHIGEEAGFVIEGFVELTIDKQTHVLGRGDSFCFRSEAPHSFYNPGPDEAVILWINTPPTF